MTPRFIDCPIVANHRNAKENYSGTGARHADELIVREPDTVPAVKLRSHQAVFLVDAQVISTALVFGQDTPNLTRIFLTWVLTQQSGCSFQSCPQADKSSGLAPRANLGVIA